MTTSKEQLKILLDRGKLFEQDNMYQLIDRLQESPEDSIVDSSINKGILSFKTEKNETKTVDMNPDSSTNKIDPANALSSEINKTLDNSGNTILTFSTISGKKAGTIKIPKIDPSDGLDKNKIIKNVVNAGSVGGITTYNFINYNGAIIYSIQVFDKPQITYLDQKKVISTIDTGEGKITLTSLDGTQLGDVDNPEINPGNNGIYDTITNIYGKDGTINGLSGTSFKKGSVMVPQSMPTGDDQNNYQTLGLYLRPDNTSGSSLVLDMSTNSDKTFSVNDVISSFGALNTNVDSYSNISLKPNDSTVMTEIRTKELDLYTGGAYEFFWIFGGYSDDEKTTFTFPTSATQSFKRADINKEPGASAIFQLFENSAAMGSIFASKKFIGEVLLPDDTDGQYYYVRMFLQLDKDTIDSSKDTLTIGYLAQNINKLVDTKKSITISGFPITFKMHRQEKTTS